MPQEPPHPSAKAAGDSAKSAGDSAKSTGVSANAPGDSANAPYLSTKATAQNTFDAIVVGSGITGGWAAKELCELGLKVLMLERGGEVHHPNYPTATLPPWQFPHRESLDRADRERSPIQARHFSYREDNKHFYINDRENPYEEIKRFDWIRGDVVGGRSLLWGRQCYRMSDLDFEANLRDGVGIDWPIRYKDIEPWYDYVEKFIGVSGNADGVPHLPDGHYQPPMAFNCVEEHFTARVAARFPDRRVIMGRTANLTQPVQGRGQCQYRNLCHRGCPYGAYFSTNASTLPAAFATGRLTLRSGSLVNEVLYDADARRATGVEVIDRETGKAITYYARLIFLNAATLATAFILLNSRSHRWPDGLGNGSGQIGRNLMDHHKSNSITGVLPGFEDKYYYGRRPTGLYIPRWQNFEGSGNGRPGNGPHGNGHPGSGNNAYIRGYGYEGEAFRAAAQPDVPIGSALKAAATEPGPWTISFKGYGETLPHPDNRVTLNTDKKDKWGRNTLTVDAEFRENEKAMNKDMIAAMREMMEAAGCQDIDAGAGMSFPGNANHEMGTARMGNDPKTSVLNSYNQMHEVPNVFITDGSFMASSGSANPSLTYMAMTARAVHYAVHQIKKAGA